MDAGADVLVAALADGMAAEGHLAYFVLELVRELDVSRIEDAIEPRPLPARHRPK